MPSNVDRNVPPPDRATTEGVRSNFGILGDEVTELQDRPIGVEDVPPGFPPEQFWVRTSTGWEQLIVDGGTFQPPPIRRRR